MFREHFRGRASGGFFIGLILVAFGLLLLFDMEVQRLWPMVLILVGIQYLAFWKGRIRWAAGVFWIGAGTLFLLRTLGHISASIPNLIWPVMLIWFGLFTFLRLPRCGGEL